MQQEIEGAPVERALERVRGLEELAELRGDVHGASGRHRSLADDLRQVPPVQVLHRDEEVLAVRAVLVHDRHVSALAAELLLQRGSPPLGFEHLLAVPVGLDRHELECDALIRPRVGGEEHDRHAPAPDLLVDLVLTDTIEDGRHHRSAVRRRGVDRVPPAGRASTNQLARANAARASLDPVRMFALPPTNTLAVISATLASSTITVACVPPAAAFRANTLCETTAVAPERTASADPGLSRMSLPVRRTRGSLADVDSHRSGAADLDVRQRQLRVSGQDRRAERRRRIANDAESRRVRHR